MPESSSSFSHLTPVSPESSRANPENNRLESSFSPAEAELPPKAQDSGEDSCVDLLGPASPEALSSRPIFLYEEIIRCQCQVSEIYLISPPEGTGTEDKSLPLAVDREAVASSKTSLASNLTPRTNTQREPPAKKDAEIPFDKNHDGAENPLSPWNLSEVSSPLMEGLAPLEEASPDIFAWEYLGLQGTERGQKPSAVI